MEANRKSAYRWLLYQAMLDIRPLGWMSVRWFNPFRWKRYAYEMHRAGVIADWLHNLALFSATDFRDFNETQFWQDFQWYRDKYPHLDWARYENRFQIHLAEVDDITRG